MSKFNKYARDLDGIVKQYMADYAEAKKAVDHAESKYKDILYKHDKTNPVSVAKLAAAEAELTEAKANFKAEQDELSHKATLDITKLRKALEQAVKSNYLANPADVDINTMTLLESGILNAADYERLISDAINNNNSTMVRLIGDAANKARENLDTGRTDYVPEREALAVVYNASLRYNGGDILRGFDNMTDTARRTFRNASMHSHWESLTGPYIERF